ncbi:MAG: hypothetical protein ABWK00_06970 [Desulfurococcaceae archaeon]
MSYGRSSVLKWLEDAVKQSASRLRRGGVREIVGIAQWLTGLGDRLFASASFASSRAARIAERLQITMIESMIIASLWFGALLLLLVLLVAR